MERRESRREEEGGEEEGGKEEDGHSIKMKEALNSVHGGPHGTYKMTFPAS